MVDFKLTEQQVTLRDLARNFVRKEIIPVRAELDREPDPHKGFSWDLIRKADEVRRALDILVDHGWIRCRPEPPRSEQGGRPPSPIFDVNPSLPEQEL